MFLKLWWYRIEKVVTPKSKIERYRFLSITIIPAKRYTSEERQRICELYFLLSINFCYLWSGNFSRASLTLNLLNHFLPSRWNNLFSVFFFPNIMKSPTKKSHEPGVRGVRRAITPHSIRITAKASQEHLARFLWKFRNIFVAEIWIPNFGGGYRTRTYKGLLPPHFKCGAIPIRRTLLCFN